MPIYDAPQAEVLIFTFKTGLLSKLAHDLKLRVARLSLDVTEDAVRGTFEANSIQVICAMKDGREAPSLLPGAARAEIEKSIASHVLEPDRFPLILFESTSISDENVKGQLTLCGVTRAVSGNRLDQAGRRVAEFVLDQRDFGIRPFTAMMGSLKIKPEIRVRVSLPSK